MCENEFMRDSEATPLDMIKALGDPVRLRVISALTKPRTVKQVGDYLGEDASKLYYHVKELYRVGLVDLVETRVVGGVAEKYYRATQYEADPALQKEMAELIEKDPAAAAKIVGDLVNALLASVMTEFSWVTNRMREHPEENDQYSVSVQGKFMNLVKEKAEALAKEMGRLVEGTKDDEDAEGAQRYYLVSLFFPIRPEA